MKPSFAAILVLPITIAAGQIPDFNPADLVLGQPDFTSNAPSSPPTASSVGSAFGVAIDPVSGKVYVADTINNRVLRFANAAALANGAAAEAVFGQATFTADSPNQGAGVMANTLSSPSGVFADPAGRLWIADTGNHRVLMFEDAASASSNAAADLVFGQPNFTAGMAGLAQDEMDGPIDVWFDQNNRLWVADTGNNRVLRFDNAPLTGGFASAVLGQPDFLTGTPATSATGMNQPLGVAIDGAGRLWVSDRVNHRVLRFDNAATAANGAAANGVLGQPNFNTNASGVSASAFDGPYKPFPDAAGTLWIADIFNHRILRFDNAATKSNGAEADGQLGQPDFTTTTSGTTAQKLTLPSSVRGGAGGSLWVSDLGNNRVLRFSPPASAADLTRPTIDVRGRKRITTSRSRVVIRGTAADASGIDRVEFKVGGQRGGFDDTRGSGPRWRAVVRPDPDKRTTVVKVRAFDTAGNRSKILRLRVIRR